MTLFHFDLRSVGQSDDLRVVVGGAAYDLRAHDSGTLQTARQSQAALAVLPSEAQQVFTHFAEVDDGDFGAGLRWIQVMRPPKPGVHLSQVVQLIVHIPENHLRAFYREQFALRERSPQELRAFHRLNLKNRPRLLNAKLAWLGLQSLPRDHEAALDALVAAQKLVTDMDSAVGLIFTDPNLANVQPPIAGVVMYDHILPDPEVDPDQFNAMQSLTRAITASGGEWAPIVPCTDKDGNPLTAGYELDGFQPGQQLYTWGLVDPVLQATQPATTGAQRTAADDYRLMNQTWTPTPGTSVLVEDGETARLRAPRRATVAGYKWTVDEVTSHHGVSVDPDSIKIDGDDNFSIASSNSYLRTLFVGYQLLDKDGKPLGNIEGLYSISATNTLLGIPVSTDPTALDFKLQKAPAVQLYFGSLGTSQWEESVSIRGALLTCLWQYGVPIVFMIAGKILTSTALFNKIVNDRDLMAAAIGVGFGVVGGGVPTAAALFNTKKVLFSFGNVVLGMALQKGMEKLGVWLVTEAGKGAIASAFGPVGWALRIVAAGMSFEQMAITTVQVLSSPACIKVKVSRAIDVALTLCPDPRHGEVGHPETAVWPTVADRYVVTLQYKDGTNKQLTGSLPATTSNDPLPLLFLDVPAGGQFRIIAGVYSANGWLAGSWQSDWMDAVPNEGTTLQLGEKNIVENLVPLAPDAQYTFKERIAVVGEDYLWDAGGKPPATTQAALSCGVDGTLCEPATISLNNSAFQVGYAWRASGQYLHPNRADAPPSDEQLYAVQNLSVLAHPGSRLKTTDIGFTNKPGIAYAPSTNAADEIDQTNFILDPRDGGMQLRQVVLNDGQGDFGLGKPDLPSWGRFPLENVDAMAIHPSNAVIAASWQNSKLMILNLPAAPVADDKAPEALLVSGQGIREGLMQGPKALAVAPDGRILVLESLNGRVQAFDTKGNPVPSFTPGEVLFKVETARIAADLDAGKIPEAFQAALQNARVNFVFNLDGGFVTQLDSGKFQPEKDPLIAAFAEQRVILSYDPLHMDDPTLSAQIRIIQAGRSWIIADPRGWQWQVLKEEAGLSVFRRPTDVEIRVEQAGGQWLVIDKGTGAAWRLAPATAEQGHTLARSCLSFFPLQALRVGALTYLDMAVEAQGYVYTLAFQGDGSKPTDYLLDVYGPDGTFVFRTPDHSVTTNPQNVVAARIAVDIWRNLYALNYETLYSPKGAPQPGLAHWLPTPPLFNLDLNLQQDFNQRNIGVVVQAFAAHGIQLSNKAFILVIDPEGTWEVKDEATIYHVYRSGDGLQVYGVPA